MYKVTVENAVVLPVLEQGQALSRSLLWPLLRDFYDKKGPSAWENQATPFYISSNGFIARAYARLALHFLMDLQRQGCTDPVTIIELGAGHGRFTYLFLRHLDALLARVSGPLPTIRCLMTDFTTANVSHWAIHPCLRPYLESGRLLLATFDAEKDPYPQLWVQDAAPTPFVPPGPVMVVGTYVFDSLVMDAFRVFQGHLQEGRTRVSVNEGEGIGILQACPRGRLDPAIIPHLRLEYTWEDLPGAAHYGRDDLDAILAWYRDNLGNHRFSMPLGAIRCLESLAGLGKGPILVVSSDKAYNHADHMQYTDANSISLHGSFSFMANHDALARWVKGRGGDAMAALDRDDVFTTAAFLLHGSLDAFPMTRLAFETDFESFGPSDYCILRKYLLQGQPTLLAIIQLLRLGGWDTATFDRLSDAIQEHIAQAPPDATVREELARLLVHVCDHAYPVGSDNDVPFEVGQTLYMINHFEEAIVAFERSILLYGDHPATRYNLALCYTDLHRLPEAIEQLDRSLDLRPDAEEVKELRARILVRMGG